MFSSVSTVGSTAGVCSREEVVSSRLFVEPTLVITAKGRLAAALLRPPSAGEGGRLSRGAHSAGIKPFDGSISRGSPITVARSRSQRLTVLVRSELPREIWQLLFFRSLLLRRLNVDRIVDALRKVFDREMRLANELNMSAVLFASIRATRGAFCFLVSQKNSTGFTT